MVFQVLCIFTTGCDSVFCHFLHMTLGSYLTSGDFLFVCLFDLTHLNPIYFKWLLWRLNILIYVRCLKESDIYCTLDKCEKLLYTACSLNMLIHLPFSLSSSDQMTTDSKIQMGININVNSHLQSQITEYDGIFYPTWD